MPTNSSASNGFAFTSVFLGNSSAVVPQKSSPGMSDVESLFRSWMATQTSNRGGNFYAPQTISDYCIALSTWLADPVFAALPQKSAFVFTDVTRYKSYKNGVEAQPGYAAFNSNVQHGSGRLHAAMELYTIFLSDVDVQKILMRMQKLSPFLAAIRTKPFALLAGISGTGKSRLVRQLARGCCPNEHELSKDSQGNVNAAKRPGNFEMIPVRPNWHDSTELLGYVTRITEDNKPKYVLTPFVKFLARAWMNEDVPFFLCLDEMNLAPVEQYFAEYLSVIESRQKNAAGTIETDVLVRFDVAQSSPGNGTSATTDNFVKETVDALLEKELASPDLQIKTKAQALHDEWIKDQGLRVPQNLVVMGTVNMDETTCTFSRKVLDRAMSFELNVDEAMYSAANLAGEGDMPYGAIDVSAVKGKILTGNDAYAALGQADGDKVLAYIKSLNDAMKNTQFKIAYRSRNEILTYCRERTKNGLVTLREALDEVTSMKILSRVEGDDQKFSKFKLKDFLSLVVLELLKIDNAAATANDVVTFLGNAADVEKSPSASKLKRMADDLEAGVGFVSYWEC